MNFLPDFRHFDFANLGFFLSFVGLLTKDILTLRFLLLGSHGTMWTIGLVMGNPTLIFWHTIFLAINSWRTSLILWERRKVIFPPGLDPIYHDFFTSLTRKEMLLLWSRGSAATYFDSPVIRQEATLDRLYFVVDGSAEVLKDGARVSVLQRGRFLGEMSFLTGRGASADVMPLGPVKFHEWPYATLREIQAKSPHLWMKIQGLLGRDLVEKVYEKHLNLR